MGSSKRKDESSGAKEKDKKREESRDGARKPRWKKFDGPAGTSEPIRVAVAREAYAALTAHAKEDLESEICGVLVGEFCEDDRGTFVDVREIIRGTAARHGAAHVTYTQETWNRIHETLDRDFPDLQIVGWYHSHPGFGVSLSEHDLFIQKNFFAAPGQIGLVVDPLGGDEAICVNTAKGIEYCSRFWVEGRERECRSEKPASKESDGAPAGAEMLQASLKSVETRLSQLVQTVEEERVANHRMLLGLGMFAAMVIIAAALYVGWQSYESRANPLKAVDANHAIVVPVGDKLYTFVVKVIGCQLPPDVETKYRQAILDQFRGDIERAEKAMRDAGEKAKGAAPAPADNASKAPGKGDGK